MWLQFGVHPGGTGWGPRAASLLLVDTISRVWVGLTPTPSHQLGKEQTGPWYSGDALLLADWDAFPWGEQLACSSWCQEAGWSECPATSWALTENSLDAMGKVQGSCSLPHSKASWVACHSQTSASELLQALKERAWLRKNVMKPSSDTSTALASPSGQCLSHHPSPEDSSVPLSVTPLSFQ